MLEAPNKLQSPSMLNILHNGGTEENFLKLIKGFYKNL